MHLTQQIEHIYMLLYASDADNGCWLYGYQCNICNWFHHSKVFLNIFQQTESLSVDCRHLRGIHWAVLGLHSR